VGEQADRIVRMRDGQVLREEGVSA
jgi:hypothetical protein